MTARPPLVVVPQYFGALVFDRRTSRYLPFDHEAADLLRVLHLRGIDAALALASDETEREAVLAFVECFQGRGFFRVDGHLDANLLDLVPPPDHLAGPLAVHLEVVAACNLACTHCFAGELPRHQHPLSVREMAGLFGDLARIGSFRLGLTGGEPLLRKDLFDVLDAALEAGLHPCLTTNALLLTEEIARELGKRPLVWLNVSLEGPTASVNDPVRGTGTFDAVVDKLELLRRHARFTLAFTVMSSNAHLVRECADLAHRVGAHTAVFRPLYPAGMALHHLDLMPTFAQYLTALDELATLERADARVLDHFSPRTREATQPAIHTSPTCGAGQHVCSISVQGDVNPCSFLGPDFETGNVRTTPFAVIWHTGQAMQRMRQPVGEDGFRGGCRARSLRFAGSVDAADPWLTEHEEVGCYHPSANVEVDGRRTWSLPLVGGA